MSSLPRVNDRAGPDTGPDKPKRKESSGVGNPELRFGRSDELVSDSGGASWEEQEHSKEGVHRTRVP